MIYQYLLLYLIPKLLHPFHCLSPPLFKTITEMHPLNLILPLAFVTTASTALAPQPPLNLVTTTTITNSSGCLPNTILTTIYTGTNETLLTYTFDKYWVSIGPSRPPADKTSSCALHTTIQSPVGFAFSISKVAWKRVATLDPGVWINVNSSW